MKRRILSIVVLTCLVLPLAPAAFAHDSGSRTVLVSDGYAIGFHRGAPPRWVHTHAPFQRWYYASRYRDMHLLSWAQLYDLYRVEVRHSRPVRHYHRRGCGHHVYRYSRGHRDD